MSVLTSDSVDSLMKQVLFNENEDTSNRIEVKGIVRTFAFHPDRIEQAKPKVQELLDELPDQFRANGGGGWSFLNMCVDKHGKQWTGLHMDMECLCALGIATGQGSWLFEERELWPTLPGGMPYFVVGDASFVRQVLKNGC